MNTNSINDTLTPETEEPGSSDRYGAGAVQLAGKGDGLYERHLRFGSVIDPAAALDWLRDLTKEAKRSPADAAAEEMTVFEETEVTR